MDEERANREVRPGTARQRLMRKQLRDAGGKQFLLTLCAEQVQRLKRLKARLRCSSNKVLIAALMRLEEKL